VIPALEHLISISEYLSSEELQRIKEFSKDKETPFILISKKKIEEKYDQLTANLPFAKIYYAMKANPAEEVIRLLHKKGSNFDVATIYEMEQLLRMGISPDKMSYGNTIKKEKDIKKAYEYGVRLFVTDSLSDLKKLATNAPGSKVFFRILCESNGADWPLSRKFGAHPGQIYSLIVEAKKLGLIPYGLSFHVGSQQRDIGEWDHAIAQCKYLFDDVRHYEGIELKMINLGGGLPAKYLKPTRSIEEYSAIITRYLHEHFGDKLPEILIEPGRYIAGDAGVVVAEIVLISKKSESSQYEWVYLDIGKFGGLIETLDEAIKYPIYPENGYNGNGKKEVILAGPTCDSMDILYEHFKYELPKDIKEGDRIYILTTGAYTYTYCSVEFNGIPPVKVYIID
jgi:ornithine decarboxylase